MKTRLPNVCLFVAQGANLSGHGSFERAKNGCQRIGRLRPKARDIIFVLKWRLDNQDEMNMVRHHDESIQLNIWPMVWNVKPTRFHKNAKAV